MLKKKLWLGRAMFVATVTVISMVSMGQVEAESYDARTDFSTTENPSGPWNYGYTGTPGSGITLYPSNEAVTDGFGTTYRWLDPASPTYGARVPGIWADITYSSSNLTLHSGNSAGEYYSVLRFVAPVNTTALHERRNSLLQNNLRQFEVRAVDRHKLLWPMDLRHACSAVVLTAGPR